MGESNADLNFCHAILILRKALVSEDSVQAATKLIRRGYELDSGMKRFAMTVNNFFRRAAAVHHLCADALINYGLLILFVQFDGPRALALLHDALELSDDDDDDDADMRLLVERCEGVAKIQWNSRIPFQALWRGHATRRRCGLGVKVKNRSLSISSDS